MKLGISEPLEQAVLELWQSGGERRMAHVVDVAFDELMVFPEGTPASEINAAAGGKLLNDKYYHSSAQLFLLRKDGVAVRALMVAPDVFVREVQNARFGAAVRLVAPGGKQLMALRD